MVVIALVAHRRNLQLARRLGLPVHVHRARPALADSTAEFRAVEFQNVA